MSKIEDSAPLLALQDVSEAVVGSLYHVTCGYCLYLLSVRGLQGSESGDSRPHYLTRDTMTLENVIQLTQLRLVLTQRGMSRMAMT